MLYLDYSRNSRFCLYPSIEAFLIFYIAKRTFCSSFKTKSRNYFRYSYCIT